MSVDRPARFGPTLPWCRRAASTTASQPQRMCSCAMSMTTCSGSTPSQGAQQTAAAPPPNSRRWCVGCVRRRLATDTVIVEIGGDTLTRRDLCPLRSAPRLCRPTANPAEAITDVPRHHVAEFLFRVFHLLLLRNSSPEKVCERFTLFLPRARGFGHHCPWGVTAQSR